MAYPLRDPLVPSALRGLPDYPRSGRGATPLAEITTPVTPFTRDHIAASATAGPRIAGAGRSRPGTM
ncbi:hypothetical protein Skr01_23410 [Sphaerisporangium krabiense]|nr:hypothetical protein Skr01_23410 [Sphaerisporangium krabiense]